MLLMGAYMTRILRNVCFVALVALSSVSVTLAQDNLPVREAVAPIYPAVALLSRTIGVVIVDVQIDSGGSVTAVRTVSGPMVLKPISELTARRWLFAASDSAGTRSVRLTFRFTIVPDKTSSAERTPIFRPPYEVEIREVVPQLKNRVDSDPPIKRKRK